MFTALSPQDEATYAALAELRLPRHTSYPVVPAWNSEFEDLEFRQQSDHDLGIYVHVPYCRQLCNYCGCTREIVSDHRRIVNDPAEDFIKGIALEVALHARQEKRLTKKIIKRVHLGGGTPTFLTPSQLVRLWQALTQAFIVAPDAELAVEIDPRVTTRAHLETLRGLGFKRVSLGIQDFDERVQKAINRIQPYEQVAAFVADLRRLGFTSINFDLIYGLPYQNKTSLQETLNRVTELAPDRIAFFRLAMIPEMFKWQRSFRAADLATGLESLHLMQQAQRHFTNAGYQLIGFDHFAKARDPLAVAARERRLWRSFQGVSDDLDIMTLGLGPSAISQLPAGYTQNLKTVASWLEALQAGKLPVQRGIRLSPDDEIRRAVMQDLYCYGEVDVVAVGDRYGVNGIDYFADELQRLEALVDQGLIEKPIKGRIVSRPLGRLLIRVVASVFDAYLPKDAYLRGLSDGGSAAG